MKYKYKGNPYTYKSNWFPNTEKLIVVKSFKYIKFKSVRPTL